MKTSLLCQVVTPATDQERGHSSSGSDHELHHPTFDCMASCNCLKYALRHARDKGSVGSQKAIVVMEASEDVVLRHRLTFLRFLLQVAHLELQHGSRHGQCHEDA